MVLISQVNFVVKRGFSSLRFYFQEKDQGISQLNNERDGPVRDLLTGMKKKDSVLVGSSNNLNREQIKVGVFVEVLVS